MENSPKTPAHIRLPKSLLDDPLWLNLSPTCRDIFITLLKLAVYKTARKFDDHGHVFDLEVGQLCMSYAEILKHCSKYISLIQVERSIQKLKKYGFLMQEVRYRKSIITISHLDTYDLIKNEDEVKSEVNLRQTCGKLEVQKKKVKKEKKENINSVQTAAPLNTQIHFSFETSKIENITPKDIQDWKEAYPCADVEGELKRMTQWLLANPNKAKLKKNWRKFLTTWLQKSHETTLNRT